MTDENARVQLIEARHIKGAGKPWLHRVLHSLVRPKMLASLFLGAVVLALLFSASDLRRVVQAMATFPPLLLPLLFGLVAVRELVRVEEWRFLLCSLAVPTLWRHALLALLGGDASQILPAGIYFQNYLLKQEEGASIARSLAATSAMQLLEAAVSLAVLCLVGVPGWWWLRVVAIVVLGGFAAFLLLVSSPPVLSWLAHRRSHDGLLGPISHQLSLFLTGFRDLRRPRVALRAVLLTSCYLAFTVASFYVVVRAYGVSNVGPVQALVIYSFVLAIVVLNPLPSDIGVSELTGVAIFTAYDVPVAQGLAMMLIIRFALLLSTELLAGVVMVALRAEFRHLTLGPDEHERRPLVCCPEWGLPRGTPRAGRAPRPLA